MPYILSFGNLSTKLKCRVAGYSSLLPVIYSSLSNQTLIGSSFFKTCFPPTHSSHISVVVIQLVSHSFGSHDIFCTTDVKVFYWGMRSVLFGFLTFIALVFPQAGHPHPRGRSGPPLASPPANAAGAPRSAGRGIASGTPLPYTQQCAA